MKWLKNLYGSNPLDKTTEREKTNKKIIIIGVTVFMLAAIGSLFDSGQSKQNKKVSVLYSEYLNPYNRSIAPQAIEIFFENCPPLQNKHLSDIEQITLNDGFEKNKYGCMDYRCEEYGWEKEIHMEVKIKNDIKTFHNEMIYIRGHTLHFWLGGPQNSGITTSKFPEVCGLKRNKNGDSVYIPVPAIGALWK